ncbi:MAG TPA: hypothetical protein VEY51_14730 [Chondromyces sp.]|nr:hypothetical protein [Chondromyces sp.]
MAINRIRLSQIKAQSPDLNHFEEQLNGQGQPYYEKIVASEGQQRFTLAVPYQAGNGDLLVFLNGQKVTATSDPSQADGEYREIDPTTIEFVNPLFQDDIVEFFMSGKGQGVAMVVDHFHVYREKPSGTIDGINRVFFLARTPKVNSEMVFRNGILLNMGVEEDYVMDGNKIIFNEAPPIGSKILVNYDVSYV